MILVIDGYNVIHAIKSLELALRRGLKESREALISFCARLCGVRHDIEKIYIVFDGTSDLYCSEENPHPRIRVLYTTTGEDADDRILEILRDQAGKSPVTVVSNDNYVANHARSLKAKLFSAAEFERYAEPRKFRDPKSGNPPTPQGLSDSAAKNITEEYKKFLGI